ncbi:MAG TPA: LLM class F420-dependent oxidoreductase [Candidatus Binatia bacterium]|nr:LLM class F420-dependent oxidoreductase [Candidatus Binatia bacterium]
MSAAPLGFGLVLPQFGPSARGPEATARLREVAIRADRLGYAVLWTAEHIVFPREIATPYPYGGRFPVPVTDPILDPIVALSYAAAVTDRVQLGTSVLVLPYRHPMVLAKQLATLDVMSNGRVLAGVAGGWLREEFELLGVPFRERGARTDEAIALMRALWSEESVTFRGRFWSLEEAAFFPKPARAGGPPIWIGGSSPPAMRRAARLGDGWIAVPRPTLEELARDVATLRRLAEESGRDPTQLGVSSGGAAKSMDELVDRLPELARIGVTLASVPLLSWAKSFQHSLELMEEFAERVIDA